MHYVFVCSIRPVAEGDVLVLRAFAWEWWALVSFQLHSPACPWARSFHSFMPQLPQLAKWEQQHRAVLWASSICELLYPHVSKGQFLNNLVLCQSCQEGQYGEGSHLRRLAAVCSVYYRGGVNFKLWSPELINLSMWSSALLGRLFH